MAEKDKMAEQQSINRLRYVKPEALDIGGVAPILGASCVDGDKIVNGACKPYGSGAAGDCKVGSEAGFL